MGVVFYGVFVVMGCGVCDGYVYGVFVSVVVLCMCASVWVFVVMGCL